MRRLISAVTLVVLLAAAGLTIQRAKARTSRRAIPTAPPIRVLAPDSVINGPVLEQHTVGAYDIRLIADTASRERIVDIRQRGHRVFAIRAADARLEQVGKDITGDRVPEVVIQSFSGGAHCCSQATVLSLGPELSVAGAIDGADGDIDFADLDGDGVLAAKIGDWRFAYWRDYAFAETPVPEVVLRWQDGRYRPACDLMKLPAPDSTSLARTARRLTDGWTDGDPPTVFWGFAVDLIYSGNAEVAWRWLERAWPRDIEGKDAFLADLRGRLTGSPCWSPAPENRPAT